MMTTTNTNITNTNINTAQQRKKRTPEQEERLRGCWSDCVNSAIIRRIKRNVRAANALWGRRSGTKPT